MALAARGARDMDSGREPVADPAEAATLRHQAVLISAQSTFVAALMTLIALVSRRA